MGTVIDKALYLMETKNLIKQAIRDKGVTIPDSTIFRAYPNLILSINDSGGFVTGSDYVPDGSLIGKINYLNITKDMIRQAIEAKGVEVPDDATFRDYAELIGQITARPGSGGGEGGEGEGGETPGGGEGGGTEGGGGESGGENIGVGDYTGETTNLLGYAKCLGKAVPVYNNAGLVDNAQYARFYISELPSFSAADYPKITLHGATLLRFTETDYLALMGDGAFETVGDFPFLSLLYRTDAPYRALYGYNWIGASDNRAYAIGPFSTTSKTFENVAYFDLYLTGCEGVNGIYTEYIGYAIRYNDEEEFRNYSTVGATIRVDRSGSISLTVDNVDKYLVLTDTPN